MPASCQIDSRGFGLGETRRDREVRAADVRTARQVDGGNSGYRPSGKQGNMFTEFPAGSGQARTGCAAAVPGYASP
jgi:hypothetical protein